MRSSAGECVLLHARAFENNVIVPLRDVAAVA